MRAFQPSRRTAVEPSHFQGQSPYPSSPMNQQNQSLNDHTQPMMPYTTMERQSIQHEKGMSLYQQRMGQNKVDIEDNQTDRLLEAVRERISQSVMNVPGLLDQMNTNEGKSEIRRIIGQSFRNANELPFAIKKEAEHYIEEIYNDICGFGPIQSLLNDPKITEIKVNGPYQVRVEVDGKEYDEENIRFRDQDHLMDIVQRIVSPIGRKVDLMTPIVDAFLPDGSRVAIQVPPVAPDGPLLSIRKFVPQLTIEELHKKGAFPEEIIPVMKALAEAALNIVISGGTGGGKTSLLNAIATFIPENESIITIEDTLELDLHHPDVRKLLTRGANIDGQGEITASHLVKTSLRMKPKRIIVGEARDTVIDDCFAAMNTGHPGSMFSVHANSPEELPERIEQLSEKPRDSILNAFGKIINIVFQVNQFKDGRRRLTHISQIGGYKDGQVIVENLFEYDYDQDRLIRTSIPFRYEKQLRDQKIDIPSILVQQGATT